MPTAEVILRPIGTEGGDGFWVATGGDGTLDGVTSDQNDTTYATNPNSGVEMVLAIDSLGQLQIPDGAKIAFARMVVRARHHSGDTATLIRGRWEYPNASGGFNIADFLDIRPNGSTTVTEYATPWLDSPSDFEWNLEELQFNNAHFWRHSGGGTVRITEMRIEIDYDEQPVADVTGPANPTVDNAQPLVEWTFTDPDGGTQKQFQVKVETGDQSADSEPDDHVVYDSGILNATAARSHQVQDPLGQGFHTFWVRVRQEPDIGIFVAHWSDWDPLVAELQFTPPAVPSLTATADDTENRVELTADANSPAGEEADGYDIQASDDGGSTWIFVRDGLDAEAAVPDGPITIQDYESPPNSERQYRARSWRTVSGNKITSDWSATQSATVNVDHYWLKDPFNPENNLKFELIKPPHTITQSEDQGLFFPKGRTFPIVRRGMLRGEDGSISVSILNRSSHEKIKALRAAQNTLLLQSNSTDQWYIVIEPDLTHTWEYNGDTQEAREYSFGYTEVERP